MARVLLKANAEVDMLTQGELRESLADDAARRERARLHGIKHMRLPENLSGKASGGVLSLGVEKGSNPVGPEPGYAWRVRRLVVTGLTAGAAPDVVNLYRNSSASQIVWQFNGNNFGYTFSDLELTWRGGETFALASTGTFNATGVITLSGEVSEVPEQLLAKRG